MDETQVPPVEPTQPATPPPTPEQAAPATAPEAPREDPNLLRAYTQGQQKLASILAKLSLPKTASAEQILAAIDARQQALASADEDLDTDPRLAAQRARLQQREAQLARQTYGDTVDLTTSLIEAIKGSSGILEATEIVDQYVLDAAAKRFGGEAPAPAGGPAPSQQQAQAAAQPQAPERELDMEYRSNRGMYDPKIQPDRSAGPQDFFRKLAEKVPALR